MLFNLSMIEIEKESLQKILGGDVRPGQILLHDKRCWQVVKSVHIKPGKGGAYMQVEMKDVQAGTKMNPRFRSEESLQKVYIQEIKCSFLYFNKDQVALMNSEEFEEIEVEKKLFGEQVALLSEGMEVIIIYAGKTAILARLPKTIKVKVTEADPSAKGQTATSSYKNAVIECGLRVQVPQFVKVGDIIIISTEDLSYSSRA